MYNMPRTLFLLSILVFLLSGCFDELDSEKEYFTYQKSIPAINPDAPLNFATLKKYILVPQCIKCHMGENAEPLNDPIDLSTYENMMVQKFVPLLIKGKPEISRLYLSVESGEMPITGTLSQEKIKFIKRWISACAPKDTPIDIPDVCPNNDDGDDEDDW